MNTTAIIAAWLGTGSLNLFGRPFAGKDTQGKTLADQFKGILLSSGDILRHDHGNQEVQRIMAAGGIIPSDLFESIMLPYMARPDFANRPLILSEVGRVPGEDEAVMRAAEQSGHPLRAVIHLNLPETEVWRRFDAAMQTHDRGSRADDTKAVLQTRLDAYQQKVMPVIENYQKHGLLVEVDGTLPRAEVTAAILNALAQKARTATA